MKRLLPLFLVLLANCSSYAYSESTADAGSDGVGIIASAVSICSTAIVDVDASRVVARESGWEAPEPSKVDPNDKSLNLVPLAADTYLKVSYNLLPRAGSEMVSGEITVRELAYPHLDARACSVRLLDFGGKLDLGGIVPGNGWVGGFSEEGDDPAYFGDASELGSWSYLTDDGGVVTIDAGRSESTFIYIQMTRYRQLTPDKE